ncbi:MAG: FkbM family methyltransferase [Elusimicrobia bacterium]|nr:FkbM family methyltransferase [Elusimicrobiota bacterium]
MRLLPWLCSRERIAVDVGANAGVYAWHLRRFCARVHAYEPVPELARYLQAALPGCVVHGYALSDRTGRATLRVPILNGREYGALASLSHGFERAHGVREVDVDVRRLDDEGLRDVGFIKIDVEGHERAVIEGARSLLADQRPTLLIEIDERQSPGGLQATVSALADRGYDAWFFHDGRLRPVSNFDRARLQNPAFMSDDGWATGTYIVNFLFFPTTPGWPGQRRVLQKFAMAK